MKMNSVQGIALALIAFASLIGSAAMADNDSGSSWLAIGTQRMEEGHCMEYQPSTIYCGGDNCWGGWVACGYDERQRLAAEAEARRVSEAAARAKAAEEQRKLAEANAKAAAEAERIRQAAIAAEKAKPKVTLINIIRED